MTDTTLQQNPPGSRANLLWLTSIILVLITTFMLVTRTASQAQLNGIALQAEDPLPDFTLTSNKGAELSLSDWRGQLILLFFGYTHCPDVCPVTLAVLDMAVTSLSAEQQKEIQVVMVTVDPANDTPAVLDSYLANFNPDFVGLTGSHEAIQLAGSPLGIYFSGHEGDSHVVEHTSSVALIDREGVLRLLYPFDTSAEAISADLKALLRER